MSYCPCTTNAFFIYSFIYFLFIYLFIFFFFFTYKKIYSYCDHEICNMIVIVLKYIVIHIVRLQNFDENGMVISDVEFVSDLDL